MSEPLKFNLRRSLYGWSSAALAIFAGASLTAWIISFTRPSAEIPLSHWRLATVSISNSAITLSSSFADTVRDDMKSGDTFVLTPTNPFRLTSDRRFKMPGISFRAISISNNSTDWLLEISTLACFVAAGLLAAIFLYRYRASHDRS
jgi:hypothetical protein